MILLCFWSIRGTCALRNILIHNVLDVKWLLVLFPQLDADEDSPNFDEDGRDEYNEIHMLV